MQNFRKLPVYLVAAFTLGIVSCESDDPTPENEGEVITNVVLNFQELDASNNPVGTPVSFSAIDPEGIEVGATPTIQTINLKKGKNYRMTIAVTNSIEGEDISAEILEEADEHQFFFLGTAFTGNIMTIAYNDPSGKLIGLQNRLAVSSSPGTNNAQMRVVLRHDLDKNFPGATNPNFQNFEQAGGETDLDITFPVVINN
ncbi:hypothetical protein D0X99_12845 [Algoriphagus lacus]|uniref:Type 1 periplasmic binding fold superfamily protein n=1 Tax=Algoriphagus lacus TaxID=2056311 RepID=A0A418PQ58_9BACT|nr:hypothetical protein [Algoriphagus lacus]RIW14443.1 hypothetical protein D0X99_12845 [Algoriphagus lacus]